MLKSIKSFINEPHIRMALFCQILGFMALSSTYGRVIDLYGVITLFGFCLLYCVSGILLADGIARWKLGSRRDARGRFR